MSRSGRSARSITASTESRLLAARRSATWVRPRKPSVDHDDPGAGAVDHVGDLVAGVAGVDRHERAAGVRHGQRGDHPADAVGRPDARRGRPVAARARRSRRGCSPHPAEQLEERDRRRRPGRRPDAHRSGPLRHRAPPGSCSSNSASVSVVEVGACEPRNPTKQLLGRVPLVDLTYSEEDQAFRAEVRGWLEEHLSGEWAALRGLGGAGRDHEAHDERVAWNRLLAEHGWTCVGWPHGVRRARAEPDPAGDLPRGVRPGRRAGAGQPPRRGAARPDADGVRDRGAEAAVPAEDRGGRGAVGAGLLRARRRAPTSPTCRPRPACDGRLAWVIDGQKVWTSNAHFSQWAFVVCRSEPGSERHHGLSFLLVPLDQDGVEVRPIEQLTGGSEFNEVFFTGARTDADLVVGEPGKGWGVAMALLGFERGVSVLAQVVGFARELDGVVDLAKENGAIDDAGAARPARRPQGRARGDALPGAARALRPTSRVRASVFKLVWANWHKRLGEVAMDVAGPAGLTARPGVGLRPRPVAATLPLLPRRHDLRRQRRGPAQHPGRARARPSPERGPRMTGQRPQTRAAHPRLRPRPRPAGRQGRRRDGCRRRGHRRGRRTTGAGGGREGGRLQRHPRPSARRGRGGAGGRVRRRPGAPAGLRRHRRGPGRPRCSTRRTSSAASTS